MEKKENKSERLKVQTDGQRKRMKMQILDGGINSLLHLKIPVRKRS